MNYNNIKIKDYDNIEFDPILPKALLDFIRDGTGSISAIQKRYDIGYARAARIIDQMEQAGFISAPNEKNRQILIDENKYNELFGDDDSHHGNTSNYKTLHNSQKIQLTTKNINEISKLFLEIINSYSQIKEITKIRNFVKGFLKKNNFFLYNRFNFLLYIPVEYTSKINLCAEKLLENIKINEKTSVVVYFIKLCQAREKYFNQLFFNNDYLNSLNFTNETESNYQSIFQNFLLSLIESNFILDTFTEKFALFYLMFEERNKLLSERFYKDYIDRLNLTENKELFYYAKEILKYNINTTNEEITMYFTGYHNNKFYKHIDLNEVDAIENANILDNLREMQQRKNFLQELEFETYEKEGKLTQIDLDLMLPSDFEKFIADLFNKLGYNAFKTKQSGDQGADVVAEKNGEKIVIQVKHFINPVGNKAIQEVVSSQKYYKAQKSMVVTNSTFTKAARELAKANDVTLWDGKILLQKIKEI